MLIHTFIDRRVMFSMLIFNADLMVENTVIRIPGLYRDDDSPHPVHEEEAGTGEVSMDRKNGNRCRHYVGMSAGTIWACTIYRGKGRGWSRRNCRDVRLA